MKWVQMTRREDLRGKSATYLNKNCRLCEKHFECSQFYNAASRDRLLPFAIPTLFEIPNPPRMLDCGRRILRKRFSSGKPAATAVKRIKMDLGNCIFTFIFFSEFSS